MASRIAGITIEIGGDTTKLQTALKGVDKSLSATQSELKDINKLLKLDPGNTELLTQKQKALKNAIDDTKKRLETLKEAQKQYGKGTAEYDAIQREIVDTENNLKSLEGEYKDFGSVAKQKLTVVTDNLKNAASKVVDFGKKAKEAFMNTAKALVDMGEAAIDVGKQVYNLAVDAAETADNVDKMSQKIGISREAYQELDFAMSQSGASVDSLQAGMKTLRGQMTSAASGNKKTADTFKKLGVSVRDTNGHLRSQEDVMFDTLLALQNVQNETERARLANELFGKSGTDLLPLLNSEAGSIDDLRQQAHDLGLVMGDEAIDAGVRFSDSLDAVKKAFSAITTQIGLAVMPVIQTVLDWIMANMPMIQEIVHGVVSFISKIVGNLVSILSRDVLPFLKSFVEDNIKPALKWFEKAFDSLAHVVKSLIHGDFFEAFQYLEKFVFDAIAGILKVLGVGKDDITRIMKVVHDVLLGIRDVVEKYVIPIFNEFVQFIKNVFSGNWSAAWENIINIFKLRWEGIKEFFSKIFNAVVNIIKNIDWSAVGMKIWLGITTAFNAIANWFGKRFEEVVTWLKSIDWPAVGMKIWNGITKVFNAISSWFGKRFEEVVTWLKSIDWPAVGMKIWNGITKAFNTIASWFGKRFDEVVAWIKNIDWASVGMKIWTNITKAFNSIASWFGKRFDEVVSWIKGIDWASVGMKIWTGITKAFNSIADWFGKRFDEVVNWIKGIDWGAVGMKIWNGITNSFISIGDWFKSKFETAAQWIKDIKWGDVGTAIWDAIKNALSGIGEWLKNTFKSPINAVIRLLNSMIGKVEGSINSVINGINNKLKVDVDFGRLPAWMGGGSLGGIHWSPNLSEVSFGRIHLLANGGILSDGMRAIVGEYAPEMLHVANGKAIVTPIQGAERWQNNNAEYNFNIYQQPGEDANALAHRVMRIMTREQQQRIVAYA